jgi:hypothetical protein
VLWFLLFFVVIEHSIPVRATNVFKGDLPLSKVNIIVGVRGNDL